MLTLAVFPGCHWDGDDSQATPAPPAGPVVPPTDVPADPTNLTAAPLTSTSITLNWTDNSTDEDQFNIYRSPDDVTFTLLTTVGVDITTFTDTGLNTSTQYFYQVSASNVEGESGLTPSASATTLAGLPAPTNLSGAVVPPAPGAIALSWSTSGPAVTNFRVEHSPDGVTFTEIGTPTTTSFTHTTPVAGTNHYRVRGFQAGPPVEFSAFSASIAVDFTAPAVPTNLIAVAVGSHSIELFWVDNSTGESGFQIFRSFTGQTGTFVQVAITGPDTTQYTDSTLHPNTTYHYYVTATNFIGTSSPSNTALATTFTGAWLGINGSGEDMGISGNTPSNTNTTFEAAAVSVAGDNSGTIVVVWEQNVLGVDQIYMALFDSNVGGPWQGVAVNLVRDTVNQDPTTGAITGVTWFVEQLSNNGNGLSQSAGDAQDPVVAYDPVDDTFFITWQERRNGNWEIVTREMGGLFYDAVNDFWRATWSDSTAFANITGVGNEFADDEVSTGNSLQQISPPTGSPEPEATSLRPQVTIDPGANLYVVWQEFVSGTWQVYGASVDVATYAVASIGAGSNTGTGISGTASHSTYPTIARDNGTGNVYVAWQELDTVNVNWDIVSETLSGGVWGGNVALTANAGTGDSQHPKAQVDISGLPHVVWDDNTSGINNHEIFLVRGNAAGSVWAGLNDGVIDSSTGSGISVTSGASQFPSIDIDGVDVYVAWHDATAGNWEIYVRKWAAGVPDEGPAWVEMGASVQGGGVSITDGSSLFPTIRVGVGGSIYLVWEDDVSGRYNAFFRIW